MTYSLLIQPFNFFSFSDREGIRIQRPFYSDQVNLVRKFSPRWLTATNRDSGKQWLFR